MKRITVIFLVVFISLTTTLSAQKNFSGVIKSSFKIEGTEDPNILSQLPPESEIAILGNKSKTTISFQGGAQTMINNGDDKSVTVLLEINGVGKYYTVQNKEKIAKMLQNADFKYDYTEEFMTIVGYKCQKVLITVTDLETDEVETAVAYVSKELNNTDAHNFSKFPGLVGIVLRSEINMGESAANATLITEAIEINTGKKIKELDFLIPADAKDIFKDTTPEEKQMLGIPEGENE